MTETGEVKNLDCFVYIMYEDKPVTLPSNDYLELCLEGYRNFNFDEAKIDEALKRCKQSL